MLAAALDSPAMVLPDDLSLRDADEADLPALGRLRASVGWGVHDWALRAVLRRPARCLVAVDGAGAVVASGSGIAYGRLGFIGNMVVARARRRQGIGSAILEAITEFLSGAGCDRLELYATSDGRPLYASHGFEIVGTSAMASVPAAASVEADPTIRVDSAGPEALEALVAYDRPRFGGDRRTLLAMMLTDPDRPLLVARRAGLVAGHAWLRPEAARIGPFLADTPAVAASLLSVAAGRMPDAEHFSLNLPLENRAGVEWLRDLGVALDPWDGRMGRGPQVPRRDDTIYGNAVGALG